MSQYPVVMCGNETYEAPNTHCSLFVCLFLSRYRGKYYLNRKVEFSKYLLLVVYFPSTCTYIYITYALYQDNFHHFSSYQLLCNIPKNNQVFLSSLLFSLPFFWLQSSFSVLSSVTLDTSGSFFAY